MDSGLTLPLREVRGGLSAGSKTDGLLLWISQDSRQSGCPPHPPSPGCQETGFELDSQGNLSGQLLSLSLLEPGLTMPLCVVLSLSRTAGMITTSDQLASSTCYWCSSSGLSESLIPNKSCRANQQTTGAQCVYMLSFKIHLVILP